MGTPTTDKRTTPARDLQRLAGTLFATQTPGPRVDLAITFGRVDE